MIAPPDPRARVKRCSRRRLLTLTAAVAGLGVAPMAALSGRRKTAFEWRGTALGASARLVLHHPDRDRAERGLAACLDEIDRLEQEFSLFRADSALSTLNRDGRLERPSLDMQRLLNQALHFGAASGGAFDVTVQPLWRLYAEHFAARPEDDAGPPAAAVRAAMALVDQSAIELSARRVVLGRAGMAVTLNGIAQGYITDRVAELLRGLGFAHVLVDIGEIVALDRRPDGAPWRIGLDHAGRPATTIELVNQAIATSSGSGTRFDRRGRFNHIIDPRDGGCASVGRTASVIARDATSADALATALCLAPTQRAAAILAEFEETRVIVSETTAI